MHFPISLWIIFHVIPCIFTCTGRGSKSCPEVNLCITGLCNNNNNNNDGVAVIQVWKSDVTDTDSYFSIWWYYPQHKGNTQLDTSYVLNGQQENYQYTIQTTTPPGPDPNKFEMPCSDGLGSYSVDFHTGGQLGFRVPPVQNKLQWMYDRKTQLEEMTLAELVIPGTHESAAYPSSIQDCSQACLGVPSASGPRTYRQDKSIITQLRDGIRYIELQPANVGTKKDPKYVVTHDSQPMLLMDEVARQINDFIACSEDVVIISFTGCFDGIQTGSEHSHFITYLKRQFRKDAYHRTSKVPKLKDFWRKKNTLFLIYDNENYRRSSILWPGIPRTLKDVGTSVNTDTSISLAPCGTAQSSERGLHVDIPYMTGKTTNGLDASEDPRTMANKVFGKTFNWATGPGRSSVNILAVDYYQVTGVVDLAIQLNEHRGKHPSCIGRRR